MKGFLERLLNGQKVEWRKLGEVCEFQNGFAFKSNLFKDSGVPIIRITNVDGVEVDLSDVKYFNPNDYKEKLEAYKITYGDILIAMSGATTGKIGFYSDDNVAYLNQRVGKFVPIKDVLNNRYLYHYLLSQVENIYIMAGGGVQPNLSSNILMSKLPIPIPPLPVQAEIVRILDALTTHTAELTAELTARKKQYNFYREKLLTFGEGVEWKKLGEVYDFQYGTGNTIPKTGGQYPVYGSNGIVGSHDEYNSEDSPIIGHIGAYAGIVNWGSGKHFVTYNGVICRHKSKDVLPKYAYYLLLLQDFGANSKNASHPFVSYDTLKAPLVPIPPLPVQKEIVQILDALTTHTAELTTRSKQYSYYRDKLLNFEL